MAFHLTIFMVYFAVPLETLAYFNPKENLGEEYADLSSERAQQLIEWITPEVRFIHMFMFFSLHPV